MTTNTKSPEGGTPKIVLLWFTPKGVVAFRSDNMAAQRREIEDFTRTGITAEGALVLDTRKAPEEASQMIRAFAPTPDATLPPETYEPAIKGEITGPDGEKGMAVSSMDRVSVDLWTDAWVDSIPGTRMGHYLEGSVRWERSYQGPEGGGFPGATQAPGRA